MNTDSWLNRSNVPELREFHRDHLVNPLYLESAEPPNRTEVSANANHSNPSTPSESDWKEKHILQCMCLSVPSPAPGSFTLDEYKYQSNIKFLRTLINETSSICLELEMCRMLRFFVFFFFLDSFISIYHTSRAENELLSQDISVTFCGWTNSLKLPKGHVTLYLRATNDL